MAIDLRRLWSFTEADFDNREYLHIQTGRYIYACILPKIQFVMSMKVAIENESLFSSDANSDYIEPKVIVVAI